MLDDTPNTTTWRKTSQGETLFILVSKVKRPEGVVDGKPTKDVRQSFFLDGTARGWTTPEWLRKTGFKQVKGPV